jgi:hypothetical protein
MEAPASYNPHFGLFSHAANSSKPPEFIPHNTFIIKKVAWLSIASTPVGL